MEQPSRRLPTLLIAAIIIGVLLLVAVTSAYVTKHILDPSSKGSTTPAIVNHDEAAAYEYYTTTLPTQLSTFRTKNNTYPGDGIQGWHKFTTQLSPRDPRTDAAPAYVSHMPEAGEIYYLRNHECTDKGDMRTSRASVSYAYQFFVNDTLTCYSNINGIKAVK